MMGHKDKLKSGMEFDVIFARKIYCYLKNNYKLIKYVKKSINRRNRQNSRLEINKILNEDKNARREEGEIKP